LSELVAVSSLKNNAYTDAQQHVFALLPLRNAGVLLCHRTQACTGGVLLCMCVLLQVAKISDFGLAATLLDGATHRSTASMGTM
jgi:hypothetical protein